MNMPTDATYRTDPNVREQIEREMRCLRADGRSPRASFDAARLDRRGDPAMRSIMVRGVVVAFLDQGEGEPVVLLHCSGSSSAQWRALIDALSAHYRVIAPDLFGYGATPLWPGHAPFSLGHEAEIVVALLGMLGEPALFTRDDEVEAAWTFINRILDSWRSSTIKNLPTYEAGTWGPREADNLIEGDGRRGRRL